MEAVITSDVLSRAGLEVVRVSVEGSPVIKCANGLTLMADSCDLEGEAGEAGVLILPGGWEGTQTFCKVNQSRIVIVIVLACWIARINQEVRSE